MVSTTLSSGPRRVESVVGVERVLGDGKRVFAETYKQSLVERCLQPGTSVSRVALEHGINANLLRKWIDKRSKRPVTVVGDRFEKNRKMRWTPKGANAL